MSQGWRGGGGGKGNTLQPPPPHFAFWFVFICVCIHLVTWFPRGVVYLAIGSDQQVEIHRRFHPVSNSTESQITGH